MTDYLIAIPVGAFVGFLASFFVQGGFANFKLYMRLTKMKGKWHQQRVILLLIGIILSLYTTWLYGGFYYQTIWAVILISFLYTATVTDLRNKKIHVDYILFYTVCFFIFHLFNSERIVAILSGMIGALTATTVLGIPRLLKPNSIGLGDLYLLAVCGFGVGLSSMLHILFRAMVFMLIFSVVQILRKKININTTLPFAPFLLLSCLF